MQKEKSKRGRKKLEPGKKKVDVRYSIQKKILDEYGGKENLLKKSVLKKNDL